MGMVASCIYIVRLLQSEKETCPERNKRPVPIPGADLGFENRGGAQAVSSVF